MHRAPARMLMNYVNSAYPELIRNIIATTLNCSEFFGNKSNWFAEKRIQLLFQHHNQFVNVTIIITETEGLSL